MTRAEIVQSSIIGAAALICASLSWCAAPGISGVVGALLAVAMLAIAVIDWHYYVIPDGLIAIAFGLGLISVCFDHRDEIIISELDALARCATMGGLFFGFRTIYRQWRGREGMGLGDVKLAGVAGVWLDWPSLPIAVDIAVVSALSFVLIQHIAALRAPDLLAKLPFGTFLSPAIWICWAMAQKGR